MGHDGSQDVAERVDRGTSSAFRSSDINGLRGQKVWDEKVEGERIDRAVKECRIAPTKPALDILTTVWPR